MIHFSIEHLMHYHVTKRCISIVLDANLEFGIESLDFERYDHVAKK